MDAVVVRRLTFAYRRGGVVLDIDDLAVGAGERLFLEGPSGSGKSTLLGLVGGILVADQGELAVFGESLRDLSRTARDRFRADRIGFVFQMFNLLPYLTMVENVVLPCRFSRLRADAALADDGSQAAAAERLLGRLGLEDIARPVSELSIGQQQRVAVARALIGRPPLVVADEPTSALDADARRRFVELLLDESAAAGSSVLFVSHDASLGPLFDRRLAMSRVNRAAGREPAAA